MAAKRSYQALQVFQTIVFLLTSAEKFCVTQSSLVFVL